MRNTILIIIIFLITELTFSNSAVRRQLDLLKAVESEILYRQLTNKLKNDKIIECRNTLIERLLNEKYTDEIIKEIKKENIHTSKKQPVELAQTVELVQTVQLTQAIYNNLLDLLLDKKRYASFNNLNNNNLDNNLIKSIQNLRQKTVPITEKELKQNAIYFKLPKEPTKVEPNHLEQLLLNIDIRLEYLKIEGNNILLRGNEVCDNLIKEAKAFENTGDFENAVLKYAEFLQTADYNSELGYEYDYYAYNLGFIYLYRLEDYENAQIYLEKVTGTYIDSEYALWAAFDIGEILQRTEKYSDAREYYQRILITYSNFPVVNSKVEFETGMTYFKEENYVKARISFQRIIDSLAFLKDAANFMLGETYYKENNMEQAIPYYQTVINDYPESEYVPLAEERLGDNAYNDVDAIYAEAIELFNNKEYEKAIEKFALILKYHAEHEKAQNSMYYTGVSYFELKEYDNCIETFRTYLQKYSDVENNYIAQKYIADSYYELEQYENACIEYQILIDKYLDKIENAAALQYRIAVIYIEKLNDHNKAIIAFKKVVDNFNDSAECLAALFDIGQSYRILKEYDQALSWYNAVLTDYSQDLKIVSKARFEIGNIYQIMNKYDDAIYNYNVVINGTQPDNYKKDASLFEIGECLRKMNRFDEAKVMYQKIVDEYPNSPYKEKAEDAIKNIPENNSAYYEQGLAKYNEGKFIEAISNFETYLSTNSYEDNALYAIFYIADSYYQTQHYNESLNYYNVFKQKYSDHEFMWKAQLGISECLENLNQYTSAITEYKELIAKYDHSLFEADYYQYHIGNIYQIKLFRLDDAISEYNNLIKDFKKSIYAKYAPFDISKCYMDSGNIQSAENTLKAVIDDPGSEPTMKVRAYIEIGMIKFMLSEYNEAIINYKKGIMVPDGDYRKDMAQFYIGECYYQLKNIVEAKIAYNSVINNFPNSAYVKKANERLDELGNDQNNVVTIYIKPQIRELVIGQQIVLSVDIKDTYGNSIYPGKLNWKSENASVIEIDENTGLAKAVASGNANITVTAGEYSKTEIFNVKKIKILRFDIWENSLNGLSDWFKIETQNSGTVYIELKNLNGNYNFRAVKSDMVTILGYGPSLRIRKNANSPIYLTVESFSSADMKMAPPLIRYQIKAHFVQDRAVILKGGVK